MLGVAYPTKYTGAAVAQAVLNRPRQFDATAQAHRLAMTLQGLGAEDYADEPWLGPVFQAEADTPSRGWGDVFKDVFEAGTEATFGILKGQFGTPENIYIQEGPGGKVIMRAPSGQPLQAVAGSAGLNANVGGGFGGGFSTGMIVMVGVGVLAVVLLTKGKR
jgi:hypothetical protein